MNAAARLPLFCDAALAERIERVEARLIAEVGEAARGRGVSGFVIPIAGGVASFAGAGSPLHKVAGLGFGGVAPPARSPAPPLALPASPPGSPGPPVPPPAAAPGALATRPVESAQRRTKGPGPGSHLRTTLLATVRENSPRYAAPGVRVHGQVPATWSGVQSVLPVVETRPGWVKVRLAQRPNGSQAWVPAAIHGPLGAERLIGRTGARISHGCIRLHLPALRKLRSVPPGTPIDISS